MEGNPDKCHLLIKGDFGIENSTYEKLLVVHFDNSQPIVKMDT